jgi:hypothetical protein
MRVDVIQKNSPLKEGGFKGHKRGVDVGGENMYLKITCTIYHPCDL